MKLQILILLVAAAPPLVLGDTDVSLVDLIPVISQLKYVVQTVAGEHADADTTLTNFMNYGIGPAQIRSIYNLITGEPKKAYEIQKEFVSKLEPVLDGFPVLGHVKGVGHLIAGDEEHGWDAIKAATSNSATAAGAVLGGGVGALAGRTLTDTAISAVESLVRKDLRPYGTLDYMKNFGHAKAGEHFDVIAGVGLDAYGGSKVQKAKKKLLENSRNRPNVRPSDTEESVAVPDNFRGAPSVAATNNDHGNPPAAFGPVDEIHGAPSVSGSNSHISSASEVFALDDESHGAPSVSGSNNGHGSPSEVFALDDESHGAPSVSASNNDHGSPSEVFALDIESHGAPSVSASNNHHGSPSKIFAFDDESHGAPSVSASNNDHGSPSETFAFDDESHGAPSISASNNDHGSPSEIFAFDDESHGAPSVSASNNDHGSPSEVFALNEESHGAPSVSASNNDHGSPSAVFALDDESHGAPSVSASNNDHGSPSAVFALDDESHGAPSVSATNNDHGSPSAAIATADENHGAPSVSASNNDHGSPSAVFALDDESHGAPSVSATNNDHGSPSAAIATADENHGAPSVSASNNDHESLSAASATADRSHGAPSVSVVDNIRPALPVPLTLIKNSRLSDSLTSSLDDTPSSVSSFSFRDIPGPSSYNLPYGKNSRLSSSSSSSFDSSKYSSDSSSSYHSVPNGMLAYYLEDPNNAKSASNPVDGHQPQSMSISIPKPHDQPKFGGVTTISDMKAEQLNFQERERYIRKRQKFLDETVAPAETAAFVEEYGELLNYRYDSSLAKLDMNAIKQNMPYLDDNVKSMITSDELRTVNRNDATLHNSMTSSLAGVLKMDIEQMKRTIESDSQLIYDNTLGEQPEFVLRTCKDTGYIDYSTSPTFNSIEELHSYLKESSARLENKELILSHFKSNLDDFDGFKSLVLKYKIVDDAPVKLLIDYRVPGLATKEMANPHRFDMHLDNANYKSYIIYDVKDVHQQP